MTSTFAIGDKVCRSADRYRTVGEVVSVHGESVRVRWARTRSGCVRISNGRGLTTTVPASALVLARGFVARPLSAPPDEAWQVVCYVVNLDWHPSGQRLCEDGVNSWRFGADEEAAAVAKAREQAAAHPDCKVRLSRQSKARWIPEGCRVEREKYRWKEVSHEPCTETAC